jgi:hypothetical protein
MNAKKKGKTMTETKEKIGTEEITDVITFADHVVDRLQESKDDDGEISSFELAQDIIGEIPDAIKAWVGKDKIDDELKDLDAEEAKVLLQKALPVIQKVVKLFQPAPVG